MKVSARLLTLLAPLAPLAWLLLAAGPPPQEAPAPAPPQAAKPRVVALDRDDIVVKESVIFAPPATAIPDRNGNGVIRIEADGVTVDFGGALLLGSAGDVEPDGYAGFGIRVEGRKDVTIRNATIVGFKVGIYARECTNLRILDCNVTRNFRQRLKSTPEREDLSDWLWPHVNDDNEWMEKYGAAIYLDRCTGATVARCTGRASWERVRRLP